VTSAPLEHDLDVTPLTEDGDLVELASPGHQKVKKPGRPRVAEESIRVSTWLPLSMVDKLIHVAQCRDESVSKLVRSLLTLRLR